MPRIIFNFNGKIKDIHCENQEKIKIICQRFADLVKISINNLNFLYNDLQINKELTFDSLANEEEKKLDKINIFVEQIKTNIGNNKGEKVIDNKYENLNEKKFKKHPNLKYKCDITNTNDSFGINDIFEVFTSYKDKNCYVVSKNKNHNLDIYSLIDNKKLLSLKGHKNFIRTVRYFINNKNNNDEYLISGDDNFIVIVWDINDNYKIKQEINTKYEDNNNSCLLLFSYLLNDDYIITSTISNNTFASKSATKIYSLNTGKYIDFIRGGNFFEIYYLLSWFNKKENKDYIIQLANKKILISTLFEDEYNILDYQNENNYFSGFIYTKNENDYLCTSLQNGYINIWNLSNFKIFKIINTNNCKLFHIIQWNSRFIIVADFWSKSFKIIDIDSNYKIISQISGPHTDGIKCIKKIYHPIYGESLLTASSDYTIKLWSI